MSMSGKRFKRNDILSLASIGIVIILLVVANYFLDEYKLRILNLCAIYIVLGLSMNLINGFTGLFSLGHAGFMAVGAYTTAILTMSVSAKQANFFLTPMISPLDKIVLPFFIAIIIAGIMAALVGFLIGAPALRLKGDYLAIATLGFGEIIRIIFTNTQSLTNGALGLKSIPQTNEVWWYFAIALITIWVMIRLINSSYGRAFKAIREDEIAAEAMGINLFKTKNISFIIGAFFAGVGGGLLAKSIGTIDPSQFKFLFTFNILLIIVLGGMGSITGTIIASIVVTVGMELLRPLDETLNLGFMTIQGIPGLRMVIFSVILIVVVLFYSRGFMGTNEFSWDKLIGKFSKKPLAKGGTK
jgi:branched-chain amino acid transport system permease protein